MHGGRLDPGVHLLSKPYTRQQLSAKVRQILDVRSSEPVAAAARAPDPARHPPVEALRVLAVDDDPAALEALCELLLLEGISSLRAQDAEAALDLLRVNDVEVLLTDVVMPDMTGIELARRAVHLRPDVAVVFLTGNQLSDEEAKAFGGLALRKPYGMAQLREVLMKVGNPRKAGNENSRER